MLWTLLVASLLSSPRAPRRLVAARRTGRGWQVEVVDLRRFRSWAVLRGLGGPVALHCDGLARCLVASSQKVSFLPASCLRRRGRCRAIPVGVLPKGLLASVQGRVARFLVLSDRWIVLPAQGGYWVADAATGRGQLVQPQCPMRGKARTSGPRKLRYVHPVSPVPGSHEFSYLALYPADLEGKEDSTKSPRWDLVFGSFSPSSGSGGCVRVARLASGRVTGLETYWRADGRVVALSVEASEGRRHWLARRQGSRWRFLPLHRLQVDRFHGWRGSWLLATGTAGRRRGIFRLRPGRRRPVRIRGLKGDHHVLGWFVSLRTLVLEGPARGRCRGRLLSVVVREGRLRRLPRWAVMSRLLAVGPAGRWGLVAASGRCGRRPRLLVVRLDGRRIARVLPRRFRYLAGSGPGSVALVQ